MQAECTSYSGRKNVLFLNQKWCDARMLLDAGIYSLQKYLCEVLFCGKLAEMEWQNCLEDFNAIEKYITMSAKQI
jgi:hypothetical protein